MIATVLIALIAAVGCSAGEDQGHADDADNSDHGGVTGLDHLGRTPDKQKEPIEESATQNGVAVDFTVEALSGPGGRNGILTSDIVAGDSATVTFRLTDSASGKPLTGKNPAAWIDLIGETPTACPARVQGYIGSDPASRPEIDLNGFFLLSLNLEPSISVIDPSVNLGGLTQLYTVISLPGPGLDWALAPGAQRLLVTVPSVKQVAVIDTDSFDVLERIEVDGEPARATTSPDGRRVWVGIDGGAGESSGVAVIDPATARVVERIATGAGHHEIAFAPDGRTAYVSNSAAGTVSIIDVGSLTEEAEVPVGRQPVALDVVPGSGAVFVANRGDGTISVLDGAAPTSIKTIPAAAGLSDIRVAPGGRVVLATASEAGRLLVIDPASGEIRRRLVVKDSPDQIGFGPGSVFVRRSASAGVTRFALAGLLGRGPLEAASLPVGERPPRLASLGPGAGFIAKDPRNDAVMIANPGEDKIFYYRGGATAPAGTFAGEQLGPRAVQVVDRGLRETGPGVYSGKYRVPGSGHYEAAVFVNEPRVAQCFGFDAKPDPAASLTATPVLEPLGTPWRGRAGRPGAVRFRLSDPESGRPLAGIDDVEVLVSLNTGWSARASATHRGRGVYAATLTLPEPGLYSAVFSVPSLGVGADRLPRVFMRAR